MKGSSRNPLLSDWQLLVRIKPLTAHSPKKENKEKDIKTKPEKTPSLKLQICPECV